MADNTVSPHQIESLGMFSALFFRFSVSLTLFIWAGVILIAILRRFQMFSATKPFSNPWTVNAYLFGVVTQQLHSYCISRE